MREATAILADFASGIRFAALPISVIRVAQTLVLDHIACAVLGMRTKQSAPILAPFLAMGGNKEATLFNHAGKVPAYIAAYGNAQASMMLDYDDTYDGHPGSTVIPVALALAEKLGKNGEELIEAIVCGYEVGIRMANAIKPGPERQKIVRGINTWQTFCAAAASAKLLGLEPARFATALAHVPMHTPVPSVYGWGYESGQIQWLKNNYGFSCIGGMLSSDFASRDVLANTAILDGATGFAAMAGSDRFNKSALEDSTTWFIEKVHLKPYPACRHVCVTLDAVALAQKEAKFTTENISRIEIDTFWTVVDSYNSLPRTGFDVPFSTPMCIALLLHGVPVGHSWQDDAHCTDPALLATAHKVTLKEWDLATEKFSRVDREFLAKARLINTDGAVFEACIEIPRGDPRNPLLEEDLRQKFRTTALLLGESNTVAVMDLVLHNLPQLAALDTLTRHLRPADLLGAES